MCHQCHQADTQPGWPFQPASTRTLWAHQPVSISSMTGLCYFALYLHSLPKGSARCGSGSSLCHDMLLLDVSSRSRSLPSRATHCSSACMLPPPTTPSYLHAPCCCMQTADVLTPLAAFSSQGSAQGASAGQGLHTLTNPPAVPGHDPNSPPSPPPACCLQTADVLENVAALALKTRLKESRAVQASVSCDTWSLLSGRVHGAKIYGEGWRSPLNLTAQVLEVHTGAGGGGSTRGRSDSVENAVLAASLAHRLFGCPSQQPPYIAAQMPHMCCTTPPPPA
jgi:hypothetical protein